MHGADADRKVIATANELYWGSELSVNQIAEQLDLSKGALYGMILPEKAGSWCPDCGSDVCFDNRTARDRGDLSCPECGWEGDSEDAEDYSGGGSVTLPDMPEDEEALVPVPATDNRRHRTIVGGALLGAAAGLALVFWARRR